MSVKGSRCEAAFFLLIFFKNLLTKEQNKCIMSLAKQKEQNIWKR